MQSGSLGSSVLRQARDLDLGLSWFVSLGDKADISANDLLQFWEEDANTKVVGDVHRVVRQPAQVRPHRPAGVADHADRRRAHRRRIGRLRSAARCTSRRA